MPLHKKSVQKKEEGEEQAQENDHQEEIDEFKPSLSLRRKFLQRLKKKLADNHVQSDNKSAQEDSGEIDSSEYTEDVNTNEESVSSITEEDQDQHNNNNTDNKLRMSGNVSIREQHEAADMQQLILSTEILSKPKLVSLDESYYVEQYLSKDDLPLFHKVKVEIEFKEHDSMEYASNFLQQGM